jgi:hypothetical protein
MTGSDVDVMGKMLAPGLKASASCRKRSHLRGIVDVVACVITLHHGNQLGNYNCSLRLISCPGCCCLTALLRDPDWIWRCPTHLPNFSCQPAGTPSSISLDLSSSCEIHGSSGSRRREREKQPYTISPIFSKEYLASTSDNFCSGCSCQASWPPRGTGAPPAT